MAQHRAATRRPASEHIDIDADDKLRAWAEGLGFAPVHVAAAVGVVGASADAVCRHLHQAHGGRPRPRPRSMATPACEDEPSRR